jgi:hypothetical protein
MKNKSIYVLIIISLTIFVFSGCGHKKNKQDAKQETPEALQESKLDIISYSRSGNDLVEKLYRELAGKSTELQKLGADLDEYNDKLDNVNELFSKYNGKSDSYYSSAGNMANSISDSLLRKKMKTFISTSIDKYDKKTAELNALLKLISQSNANLRDVHTVLKIVLTLPEIEKYQNDKLPSNNEFKQLTKEQEKIIEEVKKLTPQYE